MDIGGICLIFASFKELVLGLLIAWLRFCCLHGCKRTLVHVNMVIQSYNVLVVNLIYIYIYIYIQKVSMICS